MAKLADAADLKSAGAKALWGFDSPSRHQSTVQQLDVLGPARHAALVYDGNDASIRQAARLASKECL